MGCDVICFRPTGTKFSGESSASLFIVEEGLLLRWRHQIPLIVGTHQTTWCYIPADNNHNTHCKVNLKLYFLLLLYGWHEACMSALSVSVDKHVGILYKQHLYSSLQDYIFTGCMYFIRHPCYVLCCQICAIYSRLCLFYILRDFVCNCFVNKWFVQWYVVQFISVSHEFCLQMLTNCSWVTCWCNILEVR